MAYTITLSNGTALPVVLDGVTDTTSTSITLIGKNYVGYGAFLNQNFAKLLENFSNSTAPANPLAGQIWWDSGQKILKVFAGTTWKNLASATVSTISPLSPATGDQWFDTTVGQLKAWDGSAWLTIGPAFTSGQGISGAIAETITDSLGASHVVVRFYISGVTIAILSKDATFTPGTAILGFSTIKPGLNLSTAGNFLLYNDAYNALNLGSVAANNYARTDTATTFNANVSVANNNGLSIGSSAGGDFVANVTSTAVNLRSVTSGKNLNLLAPGQTTPAISIASGTGLATVIADPVAALGVATKQYVDSAVGTTLSSSTTILRRDGTNTITGTLTPDVTAIRDFGTTSLRFAKIYATSANIAGQVELLGVSSGIKFNDGTVQTTAATSPAAGSITPDRLSSGGPYWAGDGSVGVGTASLSTSKLTVQGNVTIGGADNRTPTVAWAGHLNIAGTGYTGGISLDGSGMWLGHNSASRAIIFATNSAERVRVTDSGSVGIGTTSPTQKLHVVGNILATGDVTAFSDVSLKTDVRTIDNSLNKLASLRGVNFTRVDTGVASTGLIAQEVEKIMPEVVHTNADGIKSVAYGNLVGLLIEAVKELKAEVDELKRNK